MATTERTVDEAHKYINESITHWISTGEEKKVKSLAGMAEKWRSKTGGQSAMIKALQKSIKGLDLIIKRNEKVGIPSGILSDQLDDLTEEYKTFVAEYGEPKTKIKREQNNLPKEE